MRQKQLLGAVLLTCFCTSNAMATHLLGGEIQVRRIDCTSLTYEITLIIYVNRNSGVTVGGFDDWLDFGDGKRMLVPEIVGSELVDEELGVGKVTFTVLHTYGGFLGAVQVTYYESNRNEGVVNMTESAMTPFGLETYFIIEPWICNSSPVLLVPPVDRACSGVAFYHNAGAVDPDGDSLSYELVAPIHANEYLFPNVEKFYSDFQTGNEENTNVPLFKVDPVTGTLTWDAPDLSGPYAMALKISEWRLDPVIGGWIQVGYVIRDMQVIVEECENRKPELTLPENICVFGGESIQFKLPASDPDGHLIFIEVFSDAFSLIENQPVISPPNGTLQSTAAPFDTASINFNWNTTCAEVRDQPYKLIFKISDKPESGPRLVRFYSATIKITPKAPLYDQVSVNPIAKHVTLEWEEQSCDKIQAFQVWRRTSSIEYNQNQCNSGVPDILHYELLAEVPGTFRQYTDTGLAHGAQYCYRIVALVKGAALSINSPCELNCFSPENIPDLVESQMSIDTCIIPMPAEAPVITNVSVTHTTESSGEIMVRWTHPFEIDKIQYPPPYNYKVFRKEDGQPDIDYQPASAIIPDTLFADKNLNTINIPYRYRIELYVPALTSMPVDTSSESSSVYLQATAQLETIELTWSANTAWSNYSEEHPYHLVFRKTGASGDFVLIDSVNVNENDFHYVDAGSHSFGLSTHTDYRYKVLARGTYGNPAIASPLENFSQEVSVRLLDITPPCPPELSLANIDCREYACSDNPYYNVLEWKNIDPVCAEDIVAYEIFVSDDMGSTFASLGLVNDNAYVHKNLPLREKCYRIVSIDFAGNRSDSSAIVCGNNCVNFKLPNIITPGNEDGKNDALTTFSSGASSNADDCPRSVANVDLSIFNRWGKKVFQTSIESNDEVVYWDGITETGKEVATGIYFYSARVRFDTTDPSKRDQKMKGWIQVVR